jgi:hypothetical protein
VQSRPFGPRMPGKDADAKEEKEAQNGCHQQEVSPEDDGDRSNKQAAEEHTCPEGSIQTSSSRLQR